MEEGEVIQKMERKIVRELSLSDHPLISKSPVAVYRRRLLVLIGGALASAAICLYFAVLLLAVQVGSPWVKIAIIIPVAIILVALAGLTGNSIDTYRLRALERRGAEQVKQGRTPRGR